MNRLTKALALTALALAVGSPEKADAGGLTKAQVLKLIRKEVQKIPAGPAGPPGPPGPPGPTGAILQPGQEAPATAFRYAAVTAGGAVIPERSSGIRPENVFLDESGTLDLDYQAKYCLVGLGEIKGAQITLSDGGADPEGGGLPTYEGHQRLGFQTGFPGCEHHVIITDGRDGGSQPIRHEFYVWIY